VIKYVDDIFDVFD